MNNDLFRMFTWATVILSLVTLAGIVLWARDRKLAALRQSTQPKTPPSRKNEIDVEIIALKKRIEELLDERKKLDAGPS